MSKLELRLTQLYFKSIGALNIGALNAKLPRAEVALLMQPVCDAIDALKTDWAKPKGAKN